MKKVFVAGAYNDNNVCAVLDNIREGIDIAKRLLTLGYAPFCPWLDFMYHLVGDTPFPSLRQYREYCIEYLKACDILLIISGETTHDGVKGEIEEAKKCGLPIVRGIDELIALELK